VNREYDKDAPPLDDVLQPDWRPARPELTDTTCHVLAVTAENGTLLGFASYFGCHPVVCCAATRFVHGDYPGVATNLLEREYDNVVGLFLQGAQGDVNACVVHKPEPDALLALDVIAGRYARAVRNGLAQAGPVEVERVAAVRLPARFRRKPWGLDKLKTMLAEAEAVLHHAQATDGAGTEGRNIRMKMVHASALRSLIRRAERGESLEPETELFGLRLGPVALLGSPFETFQAIKNEVCAAAAAPIPLVMSFVNDTVGYAPDHTAADRGGYAADTVPLICGELPFANVHDELVHGLLQLDARLAEAGE
jgi:hypothetical protein